jgi:hypothetical protein
MTTTIPVYLSGNNCLPSEHSIFVHCVHRELHVCEGMRNAGSSCLSLHEDVHIDCQYIIRSGIHDGPWSEF